MGCKFSFLSSAAAADDDYSGRKLKVMVVTRGGYLQEYTTRVTAAEVAGNGGAALCSSDKIFFDAFPPAIPEEEELEAGQLYFLFEAGELRRRVTGADMAALALRASRALQGRRMLRPKVMLVVELIGGELGCAGNGERMVAGGSPEKKKKSGLTSTGRVGRLRRRLSTVHEESAHV
ncbi:hypothetical protein KSP39_PZI011782 [Platanthera zijinensis]|uniref:Uncharacterized protein n=1 Tax=Platanthera zijinensis TaxID=2320716 RepID=A0AAP0BFT7_9ASPA